MTSDFPKFGDTILTHTSPKNNSAIYCRIFPKFGTVFDHMTVDRVQLFKVKRSQIKVTV